MKRIKQFTFHYAEYRLGDENCRYVLLEIDYAKNRYKLSNLDGHISKQFKNEIRRVARNLLKRKHGVNFADKLYRS